MILRVRYLVLVNKMLVEVGGKWPSADGSPATLPGKDPDTGEVKPYLLPAKVGPIFLVKDESKGYPEPSDPDMQVAEGERAYYEVWAAPENQKAAELLGAEILAGPCTRRLRIPEQHVLFSEEIWPFAAADSLIRQRSQDLGDEYADLGGKIETPKEPEQKPKEVAAAS
jgi:hypothetical protein